MKAPSPCRYILLSFSVFSALIRLPSLFAADPPVAVEDASKGVAPARASSEDSLISNFHSLGDLAGHSKIFRSANPVGKVADGMKSAEPTDSERLQAREQMQHLYDMGVRTVVSLQRQEPPTDAKENPEYRAVELEKAAAQEVGLTYVAYSMSNRGKDALSLQYMPDDTVCKLVEDIGNDIVKRSETGGVVFHCKSGKDRTGLVAAYLRIKYQDWTLDQAIAEMRLNGHVWKSFLKPGNSFSWHEEHLRTIAERLSVSQ